MEHNKKILIGYDAKRIVRNATGLGGYGRTLVNDIIKRNEQGLELLLYAPDKGRDELRNRIVPSPNARFVFYEGPCRLLRYYWRMRGIVKELKRDNVRIYHGLTGELPMGLKASGINGVVTIHDLIFMRHPEYYNAIDVAIYKWKFRVACKEATRIIAISERTKQDIMELGGVPEEKIDLIYQSCNPRFGCELSQSVVADVKKQFNIPARYILNVGTIEERKNIILAVKALPLLPDDVHLVVVGRQTKYTRKVLDTARSLAVEHRVHILCGVDDTALQALYQCAEVFVYPSRYEGFGIPIIEAVFNRLPVVACTGSCLEEAGGPHNFYVAPDDTQAMVEALKSMLIGAKGRDERIAGSLEYVQRFRGNDVAAQVLDVYAKLI